jgi:hypothetical protein
MTSDTSLVVLVTKSFGALEATGDSDPEQLIDQIAINDAVVTIEGAGTKDTLYFVESGLYVSLEVNLIPGTYYTLRVSSPTRGEVTASTECLSSVLFESVSARILDTGFDTLATINYSFGDLPGENYYMVNVQHATAEDEFENYDILNPRIFTHLKVDEQSTDNQIVHDSFNVFFRRDFIPGDTILVQLGNISKGYYDFLELREDARFNFADFVGEPINYPTNVLGGLGWFTLHLPDNRFIIVQE